MCPVLGALTQPLWPRRLTRVSGLSGVEGKAEKPAASRHHSMRFIIKKKNPPLTSRSLPAPGPSLFT